MPSIQEVNGLYGYSVAQDGDYAVVGAPGETFEQGAAYVYTWIGGEWQEQARLTATDGQFFDQFGCSVAMEGDYIAIGAYGSDNRGPNSGSVYIFKRNGSTWNQEVKLLPWGDLPNNNRRAAFGVSVSLSGNLLLVGAWRDWRRVLNSQGPAPEGYQTGAAYLFNRDGSDWNPMARLLPNNPNQNDLFGRSVAINGVYAIVGAPSDQAKGRGSGAAYIFTLSMGNWVQTAKLSPTDGGAQQRFGFQVGINGDGYAVISAPQDATHGAGSGAVYVYRRSGNNWPQQQKIMSPTPGPRQLFGESLDLRGDVLLIGEPGASSPQPNRGRAFRYVRSGSNWSQDQIYLAGDGNGHDTFGHGLSSGPRGVLIGAYQKEQGGAAYHANP